FFLRQQGTFEKEIGKRIPFTIAFKRAEAVEPDGCVQSWCCCLPCDLGQACRFIHATVHCKGERNFAERHILPAELEEQSNCAGMGPIPPVMPVVDGNHFQHPAGDCHPYGILCLQAHSASVTARQVLQ
uniref:Uncharacterized protein n=1 Tax=Nomascus leucogenys TaxID=61853 RepID=A0A2I3GLI3_NOMLE